MSCSCHRGTYKDDDGKERCPQCGKLAEEDGPSKAEKLAADGLELFDRILELTETTAADFPDSSQEMLEIRVDTQDLRTAWAGCFKEELEAMNKQ